MNKIKTLKYKTNNGENSIFNKITKRYSNVKFLRSSSNGNNPCSSSTNNGLKNVTTSQPNSSSGSYDMTGDLKREIGAPVLISKTSIDVDNIQPKIHKPNQQKFESESPLHLNDTKFSFPSNYDNGDSAVDTPMSKSRDLQKNRSKSATNLHKSEIKVFLQRAPSLLEIQTSETNIVNSSSSYQKLMSHNNINYHQKYTKNKQSSPPPAVLLSQCNDNNKSLQNCIIRKPSPSDENNQIMFAKDQQQRDSDNYYDDEHYNLSSSSGKHFNDTNKNNRDSFGSTTAMTYKSISGDDDEADVDHDLRSTSFQSLDARDLFLSIEELNEITQQLDDSEEYQHEMDLEYCEHRDKLRPDERRITLLRNKNHSVMNLDRKKEKISHAWSGLKHWIGEERDKIKDVVQKHAALQRVGGMSHDLNSGGNKRQKQCDEDSTLSKVGKVTTNNSFRRNLNGDNSEIDDKTSGYSNFSRSRSLKSSKSEEKESVPKYLLTARKNSHHRTNDILEVNFVLTKYLQFLLYKTHISTLLCFQITV